MQVEQRRHARVHREDDIPAAAAVAAVRPAEWLELLPVHGRASMTAVARTHRDGDVVGELGHFSIASWWPGGHMPRGRTGLRSALDLCLALRRNLVRRRAARGSLDHAHGPPVTYPAERDHPVDEREQGVVLAAADARSGVEVGAALAHDDLARVDQLAAEALDAQPLGSRVTAVAAG